MKSMKQYKYVYDNNIQIIKRKIFFSQTVSNILNQKRYSKKELVEEKKHIYLHFQQKQIRERLKKWEKD